MQELIIHSTTCGGCASRIIQAVKNLDAQTKIEVDLSTRQCASTAAKTVRP